MALNKVFGRKETLAVALIFFVVLCLRLFFTIQTPEFSSDESYWVLNQIESIKETGYPEFYDPYAYGGRLNIFAPLYHYLLSLFSMIFTNIFLMKLLHNVVISLSIIPVFLLSKKITGNSYASIFAAYISGFIPLIFSKTFNVLSSKSLFITLFMFLIYLYMNLDSAKTRAQPYWFIGILALTALTNYHVLILIPFFGVYLILGMTERIKLLKIEYEIMVFSVALLLWLAVLTLKRVIVDESLGSIISRVGQFSPSPGLLEIADSVILVGLIPVVFGFYIAYKFAFEIRNRNNNLLLSLLITVVTLTVLRLMNFYLGLMLLGLILSVLFSVFYNSFFIWFNKTRFYRAQSYVILGFYTVFLLTGAFPSLAYSVSELEKAPDNSLVRTLQELSFISQRDMNFCSSPNEAYLIEYYTQGSALLDNKVLFARESQDVIEDIDTMYKTRFTTEALRILSDYDLDYVIVSNETNSFFEVQESKFIRDRCFSPIKMPLPDFRVYTPKCSIK